MAKVIPIGEPSNDGERRAIALLRDQLPDGYILLHNFEVWRGTEFFEVDLAIIAPHAVYLVDVKGTRGPTDVYGAKWYPEGRQPFTSPLLKLRAHARTLKGIITASQPARRDLEAIYVDAVVVLIAEDANLVDPTGRDAPSVVALKRAPAFFQSTARVPGQYGKNIGTLASMVLKAIQGASRARSGPLRFGSWEVIERLGGTDAYTEYRATNMFAGRRAGTVLLRAYRADAYLPRPERDAQRRRIANAYQALSRMPGHPGIAGARDFFPTENEDLYILATEDVSGQALRLHLDKPALALTLDQKFRLAADVLSALAHAHAHDVVHRNLTPATILVGTDGRVRLTGFDFARAGTDRTRTIAHEIVDELEPTYQAPELYGEPSAASAGSDVFSAGLILYELFTGEKPFARPTEVFDQSAVFPVKPSEHRGELSPEFDAWLQRLCTFDPAERPAASLASEELARLLETTGRMTPESASAASTPAHGTAAPRTNIDYANIPSGTQLTQKFVVERRLGRPGSFGVVYKVIDTLGDVSRAVKLVLHDRHSTLDRLKKEYRTLLRAPEHPNVVRVFDADLLPAGGPPFIVFEYLDGLDVGEMIENGLFSPEDALELARQVADGLEHLHTHGIYHCDIKPRNLLWTSAGAKIIDFNVSVIATGNGHGGGSRRYLPPDLDLSAPPRSSDLADRDLYALGLTLYEAVVGSYPWSTATPPLGQSAPDPRNAPGLSDLAPELIEFLLKAVSPKRADRFGSAGELRSALSGVVGARRPVAPLLDPSNTWTVEGLQTLVPSPPNTNPFVHHLLTLYSQSQRTNSGTRGLDSIGEQTYVETALDRELVPSVLAGEFRLVIISGNAGDGKTAFLQKLEGRAEAEGAAMDRSRPNGCRFTLGARIFLTNHDGSQDEGERSSDDVLRTFFAPFEGADLAQWPKDDVHLIAINEGRLVDFLATEEARFPLLAEVVRRGLVTGSPERGVAVVNLNLRSVVVARDGYGGTILERLLRRMTHKTFWEPCHACDLKDRCYVFHNARTFQDETAGPRVTERLQTLFTLTNLRGRLHITLRDLRSALAFMIAGTRDCDAIHELYHAGDRDQIAQGFYFNSWMGGEGENSDRLLTLLKGVDVGWATDPRLDRSLDFVSPADDRSLFRFEGRSRYDLEVLRRLFDDLPRDATGKLGRHHAEVHRRYVAMARRRSFFERRDSAWMTMLPYRASGRMLAFVRGEETTGPALSEILRAINRAEGLSDPDRLGGRLALQVRQVDRGTVRSYRVFPRERFSLRVEDEGSRSRFVEHMPTGLILRYDSDLENGAELRLNLDVFEMLQRLNEGYRPSLEEEQGYYLSLAVFKNVLGSAPYQEVLLTTTGHDFFRIERLTNGQLEMSQLGSEVG
jgi:serine/threonine protein kinase